MRKLQLALVTVIILGLILGPMGCGKRPSTVIPPSIVESISPSSGASRIAADEAITIQFKLPIWASDFPVSPGAEPLRLDSSEVADRFRIIDAATGEIVSGTVIIEDGVKLTFELPVSESWKPHNTYWIEATADASLEETYEEGAWQNLFLSAFTTQDLDADQFPVHHPIGGSLAQLLNDIAYDVDTSRSLSFDELKNWIETAPGEAEGTSLTKFHFWPNIINLTEVYYAGDGHALFNDILDQLLEREPNRTQLQSDLTTQVARGDRVFSACDFISSLMYGFKTYWEVYYGLVINLDNPDKTGVRKPYIQEILVHEYGADGLPLLHDPHTEKLAAIFAASATIPLGKTWDLCLRGNLKNTKYNAIVVDKLAEAPDAEFYIKRVDLTCGCDFFSDLDTSVPDVPKVPLKPPWKPWNPVPEPVWERQPLPNPNLPKNPNEPPDPEPGPGEPPIWPWPFKHHGPFIPSEPLLLPPEDTIEPPVTPGEEPEPAEEEKQGKTCSDWPTKDCTRASEVQDKLDKTEKARKEQVEKWNEDKNTVANSIAFTDPDGMQKVKFNDPCLQKLRDEYVKKAKELDEPANKFWEERPQPYKGIKVKKDIKDPSMRALAERKDWWGTILCEIGPWSDIVAACGPSAQPGPPTLDKLSKKQQLEFRRRLKNALVPETPGEQGKTWNEAVNAAVNGAVDATFETEHEVGESQLGRSAMAGVYRQYAKCLKEKLFIPQFKKLLEQELGEDKDDFDKLIDILFNGKTSEKLSKADMDEYARIKKALEDYQKLMEEYHRLGYEAYRQKENLNGPFQWKAWRCCLLKSLENQRRLFQQGLILKRYLEWCELKDPNDIVWPSVHVYPTEYESTPEWKQGEPVVIKVKDKGWNRNIAKRRNCVVLCNIIKDNSEFANFKGLRDYVEWLIRCYCQKLPCGKLVEPCDPECEICPRVTPPPTEVTPPPAVTPPPTITPPPTVTPPPTEVTPPPTEVTPPPT